MVTFPIYIYLHCPMPLSVITLEIEFLMHSLKHFINDIHDMYFNC